MSDWSAGYVTDIGYTYGYCREMNPLHLRLAFLTSGIVPPEIKNACELGFGQGISINAHAAATSVRWYGTDFNPGQTLFARSLAATSEADVQLYDNAFADFTARTDLPEFDFIGLHGIWSWVSPENQQILVDFINKKLRVGGVLYISYNTMPGWNPHIPLQHLLAQHGALMSAEGVGIPQRLDNAIAFAERFIATKPAILKVNPSMTAALEHLQKQDRTYLAHEYFNRHWNPLFFADIQKKLVEAKLNYACSAFYPDNLDDVNLTPEQNAILQEIPSSALQETLRDFLLGKRFRRDYWVRGEQRIPLLEQAEGLRKERLILTTPRQNITMEMQLTHGKAGLNTALYNPLLDLLSDHQPHTIRQLEQEMLKQKMDFGQVVNAILILATKGDLSVAQDEKTVARAKPHTTKLNQHLLQQACYSNKLGTLASPVTGGGLAVSRFHQLFLLGLQSGRKQPEELAAFVWHILQAQGEKLVKAGQALQTPEENLAELGVLVREFIAKTLPVLRALQVV